MNQVQRNEDVLFYAREVSVREGERTTLNPIRGFVIDALRRPVWFRGPDDVGRGTSGRSQVRSSRGSRTFMRGANDSRLVAAKYGAVGRADWRVELAAENPGVDVDHAERLVIPDAWGRYDPHARSSPGAEVDQADGDEARFAVWILLTASCLVKTFDGKVVKVGVGTKVWVDLDQATLGLVRIAAPRRGERGELVGVVEAAIDPKCKEVSQATVGGKQEIRQAWRVDLFGGWDGGPSFRKVTGAAEIQQKLGDLAVPPVVSEPSGRPERRERAESTDRADHHLHPAERRAPEPSASQGDDRESPTPGSHVRGSDGCVWHGDESGKPCFCSMDYKVEARGEPRVAPRPVEERVTPAVRFDLVEACDARRRAFVATTNGPDVKLPGREPWGARYVR